MAISHVTVSLFYSNTGGIVMTAYCFIGLALIAVGGGFIMDHIDRKQSKERIRVSPLVGAVIFMAGLIIVIFTSPSVLATYFLTMIFLSSGMGIVASVRTGYADVAIIGFLMLSIGITMLFLNLFPS